MVRAVPHDVAHRGRDRDRLPGRVKVGKLNVDENGATSMRYNVRGIPTLLLFKGGQVVEQKVGAVGKTDVQKMIDAHLRSQRRLGRHKPWRGRVSAPSEADPTRATYLAKTPER